MTPAEFESAVRAEVDEIATMLVAKNRAYGDSALSPLRVFSKATPVEQLLVRIDDKLSRLARGVARNGAYGVASWYAPTDTVTGSAQIDNGPVCVADPRVPGNPELPVRWYPHPKHLRRAPPFPLVITTEDGSWHRPITLRERAALQGLTTMADGSPLRLLGTLSQIAKHIGNAVPVGAALAIAGEMLRTLVLASTGAFMLSSTAGVWVKRRRDGSFPLYLDQQLRKVSKRRRRRAREHVAALPVVHNTSVCGEQPGFFGAVMQ